MKILNKINTFAFISLLVMVSAIYSQPVFASQTHRLNADDWANSISNGEEVDGIVSKHNSRRFTRFNPLAGSWTISITPDGAPTSFVNYATFHPNNTSVSFDTDGLGSVGVYKRVGFKKYAGEFVGPCGCDEFPPGTTVRVSVLLDYAWRSQELSGRFVTRIISVDGNELAQFVGSARGEKLSVDYSNLPTDSNW